MRALVVVMAAVVLSLSWVSSAAQAKDAVEMTGSGGRIGGVVERSSSTTAAEHATVRLVGRPAAPAPAPRVTKGKREIVYDYRHLGGGRMHYIYDSTRDWCDGGEQVTYCYGPRPEPVKGKPGRAPLPPPLTPTEVVERTLVNVRLPSPEPNIDPGYAVTGLKAYLETGNRTQHSFQRIPTVLGPLSITASSSYTVDWGDGTTTGPHESTGGKYPDGTITHVYSDAETVDITVTQHWTAQWSLAGQSGTITGLRSSGELPDFVVREVQAVRER